MKDIKQILALLKKMPGKSYYAYCIGEYTIHIHTHRVLEHPIEESDDSIINYDVVDISLFESKRLDSFFKEHTFIYLEKDFRFKDYTPIKYSRWSGLSTGEEMPIHNLCELIKYLNRLSNLSIFK